MSVLVLLIALRPAQAICPAGADVLRADVQAAAKAYDDWAWEDFDAGMAAVRQELGCLTEVVPSADVEAVYHLFALAGARRQDAGSAEAAFRGVLTLEPGYEPALALAAQGSLLRGAWERAVEAGPGPVRPLPAGAWFVDGHAGVRELPVERAALVQHLESSGRLRSWYLDGGGLPPDMEGLLASPVAAAPGPPTPAPPAPAPVVPAASPSAALPASPRPASTPGGHPSRALLLSGLASAAVGVGGLIVGEACQATMMDAQKEARAEKYYHYGLASTFGGWALTATGGGLALGAVIKGRW